jgi:hypothetical protein
MSAKRPSFGRVYYGDLFRNTPFGQRIDTMASPESEFTRISEKLREDTDAVQCSPAEYRAGLRAIIEDLQINIQASEESDPDDG